ncbi:MAG: hypothetical protein LBC85_09530 [Fibromonadaceae bacterium]|jgi:uncharacterized protein (TIGR02145 family)|nr:hypothetical protein [Fibromonadaceae bacterium]
MNTTTKPVFLAAIFIAIALTFSCSSSNGNGDVPSSSSNGGSSSSSSLDSDSFVDTRDNQIYKWVEIGNQIWMAENLNYNAEGSQCFDNDASNCATYGRLYSWATALDLAPNCNSSTCASQIQAYHQGVCPPGWHLATYDDWTTLTNFAGDFSVAGTKLKATTGWVADEGWDLIPGTDDFGFSALPGGTGIGMIGTWGYWWTATENSFSAGGAYGMSMGSGLEIVMGNSSVTKNELRSVRCVMAVDLPLTGTVSITGFPWVHEMLTANTSSLGGSGTISYQWMRGSTKIGANSNTYFTQYDDLGSTITVIVTRSGNSGSVTSAPTAVIQWAPIGG